MRIHIIAVGKLRHRPWRDAADDYLGRLKAYTTVKVTEARAARKVQRHDLDRALEHEAKGLLSALPSGPGLRLRMDERGAQWTSTELAAKIERQMLHGGDVAFVIGGAYGFHGSVVERVPKALSLSAMTLPHELARVVLLEQVYRAMTIIRGEPYHKA